MSEFTKGPWKTSRRESTGGLSTSYMHIDGGTWDELASVVVRMRTADTDAPEGVANAHLIAAAPDMYEALKGMVDMYVEMVDSGDCGFWDAEKVEEIIAARAALNKSEGK